METLPTLEGKCRGDLSKYRLTFVSGMKMSTLMAIHVGIRNGVRPTPQALSMETACITRHLLMCRTEATPHVQYSKRVGIWSLMAYVEVSAMAMFPATLLIKKTALIAQIKTRRN